MFFCIGVCVLCLMSVAETQTDSDPGDGTTHVERYSRSLLPCLEEDGMPIIDKQNVV